MGYHSSIKQYISAIMHQHNPNMVERTAKAKSHFRQVNNNLQPCFLKNDKWSLAFCGKSSVSLKKKEGKNQNKIFCLEN